MARISPIQTAPALDFSGNAALEKKKKSCVVGESRFTELLSKRSLIDSKIFFAPFAAPKTLSADEYPGMAFEGLCWAG